MSKNGETVNAAAGRPSPCPECGSGADEASARCRTCNGLAQFGDAVCAGIIDGEEAALTVECVKCEEAAILTPVPSKFYLGLMQYRILAGMSTAEECAEVQEKLLLPLLPEDFRHFVNFGVCPQCV